MLTADALIHPLPEVREAITAFTHAAPKMELFEGGIARGITLAPVNTVGRRAGAGAAGGARLLGRA